jgi:Zn-dependent metalloprotease
VFSNIDDIKKWFAENQYVDIHFDIRAMDTIVDIASNMHIRYKQFYQNIPVEGTMLHLHYKGKIPYSFNGTFYPKIRLDFSQRITTEQVLKIAQTTFPSNSIFSWNKGADSLFRGLGILESDKVALLPEPELVIASTNYSSTDDLRLAYAITICALSPFNLKKVFVDANDGSLLFSQELIYQKDTKGLAHSKYCGIKEITCDSLDTNLYKLIERNRGLDSIFVLSLKAPSPYWLYNDDNYWININSDKDEVAADVHWGLEQTYDYFKYRYYRNSYDGKGSSISGIIHAGTKENTAYWNAAYGRMVLGDGDDIKYDAWTSIDIVGHEFTHGLTRSTADLIYDRESGALNESYSDIFGKCVEYYALKDSFSWDVSKQIMLHSYPSIRSFSNPNSRLHPKYYKGKYYDDTSNVDNYGVHTNSSVQNYWFYLLAEGGFGYRESDLKPYHVQKIGIDTAAIIAYYTLTTYLTPESDFMDAAIYSIAATKLMFGDSSPLVKEVTNAWYAVGVLNTADISNPADFSSLGLIIYPNPANEVLKIQGLEVNSNIELYDVMGRLVLQQECNSTMTKLDIEYLTRGVHTLKITNKEGKAVITKVMKE